MQPRSTSVSPGRWLSIIAVAAGILAVGGIVSSSIVVEETAASQTASAALQRPSYLSALPDITARELVAGRLVASAIDVTTTAAVRPVVAPELSVGAAEPVATPEPEMFVVTANGLNVRAGPSSAAAGLFVLRQGEAIQIAETEGNWARITSASGQSGWAFAKYLAPATNE